MQVGVVAMESSFVSFCTGRSHRCGMFVFVGVIAMECLLHAHLELLLRNVCFCWGCCYGMFVFIGVVAMECLGKVKYGLFDKL